MSHAPRPRALVIGGARRVGRAIALALARAGCDVAITYNASEREASDTVAELRSLGARAGAHRLALDDAGAIEPACRGVVPPGEFLDVLVLSASAYAPSPLDGLTGERLARDYLVNAAAPALIVKALRANLERSDRPHGAGVVAMVDMHALGRPRKDFLSYAMSKAALVELVRSLARDLAPRVRVNGVAPGVVAWPETGHESDGASQKAYLARVPLQRAGTPQDAAEVVRWLALDAGYVTGEIVRVDGGRWLA